MAASGCALFPAAEGIQTRGRAVAQDRHVLRNPSHAVRFHHGTSLVRRPWRDEPKALPVLASSMAPRSGPSAWITRAKICRTPEPALCQQCRGLASAWRLFGRLVRAGISSALALNARPTDAARFCRRARTGPSVTHGVLRQTGSWTAHQALIATVQNAAGPTSCRAAGLFCRVGALCGICGSSLAPACALAPTPPRLQGCDPVAVDRRDAAFASPSFGCPRQNLRNPCPHRLAFRKHLST